MTAAQLITNAVFMACVVVSIRLALKARSAPATWSAATFGLLGVFVVYGVIAGPDATLSDGWTRVLVAALLLLPWLLFRFAAAVVGMSRRWRLVVDVIGLGAAASTFVAPKLPGPDDVATAAQNAWIISIIFAWLLQALWTTSMLWWAGRGQPGVTRGRVRMLALGSLLLALSISSSALPTDESTNELLSQIFSMSAGVTFLLGYAPPKLLRSAWRAGDERNLHLAAAGLLAATTEREVADVLLPGVRALLGSPGIVALGREGTPLGGDGAPVDLDDPRTRHIEVGPLRLAFAHSAAMPLFGAGEQESIERLHVLSSLAIARISLLRDEAAARASAELANQRLAATNAELEAFVYTASHDLKNPIIAIIGYVEVLLGDHAEQLDEAGRHYLERMDVNARFMQSLIRDLLELSRVGRVQVEASVVPLGDVVSEVFEGARTRHPELDLQLVADPDLPALWANRARLRQLVDNLVENSCRYANRPDCVVRISHERNGAGVQLHFRDNGVGIAPEHCERVFGMFERLDPASEGTGMGLAICRRIVESVDGSIHCVPSSDGAHFRVDLPDTALAPTGRMPQHDTAAAARSRS